MPCVCVWWKGGEGLCSFQCVPMYLYICLVYAVMNELSVPMNVVRICVTVRHMSVSMSA